MRIYECPKCGADIGDSYQGAEPDVGIGAGWYCDACDLAVGDEDGPEPFDDDVGFEPLNPKPLVGIVQPDGRSCACGVPYEAGFGLAGGGFGPYMYCPSCSAVMK